MAIAIADAVLLDLPDRLRMQIDFTGIAAPQRAALAQLEVDLKTTFADGKVQPHEGLALICDALSAYSPAAAAKLKLLVPQVQVAEADGKLTYQEAIALAISAFLYFGA